MSKTKSETLDESTLSRLAHAAYIHGRLASCLPESSPLREKLASGSTAPRQSPVEPLSFLSGLRDALASSRALRRSWRSPAPRWSWPRPGPAARGARTAVGGQAVTLAAALTRLRAADHRARAYRAGGVAGLMRCLQQQISSLAAPPAADPRLALLARR